jgi:serine acetyltransferase
VGFASYLEKFAQVQGDPTVPRAAWSCPPRACQRSRALTLDKHRYRRRRNILSMWLLKTEAIQSGQERVAQEPPRPSPSQTLRLIKADWTVNDARGKTSMALFRAASAEWLPAKAQRLMRYLYTLVVEWVFGINLPAGTSVGPGLRLNHATGLVVHSEAILGSYCDLKHGCTIGVRRSGDGAPVLGDYVTLGAACHVLGPITLGDRAEIGAGAVVLGDVPAAHTAVGNPARVLPMSAELRASKGIAT